MSTQPGTASVSQRLRSLAMLRLGEGWTQQQVADFVGVSRRSIRRWQRRLREDPRAGLLDRPRCGRPPKLSGDQAEQVLSWVDRSACDFGFATDRWTAPRLASVIVRQLGVCLSAGYLNDWLRRRGVTPQMPQRQARERDEQGIVDWMNRQWPRIKKNTTTARNPRFYR